MHADERRCVEKALLRKFKDKLVEVFGRHAKRVHQGRLDSAGHFSDPGLVVTAFDNVDFGKRHGMISFALRWQMVSRSTSMASEIPFRSANNFRRAPARPCLFPVPTAFAPSEQVP